MGDDNRVGERDVGETFGVEGGRAGGAQRGFVEARDTAAFRDTLAAGSWSTSGISQQVVPDDGITRTVRAYVEIGSETKRFLRLKVRLSQRSTIDRRPRQRGAGHVAE